MFIRKHFANYNLPYKFPLSLLLPQTIKSFNQIIKLIIANLYPLPNLQQWQSECKQRNINLRVEHINCCLKKLVFRRWENCGIMQVPLLKPYNLNSISMLSEEAILPKTG